MVTIKDLAKMAGVSPTTVSNVLHGRTGKVSPDTLKRVEQVIADCNYVSNMGGRLLSNHGSRIIGVIINFDRHGDHSAVQDPFYSAIIGNLERAIHEQGYFMMLHTSSNVEECLQMAAAWNIEGLIIVSSPPNHCKEFNTACKIPIVFIDGYPDHAEAYANVGLQDQEGGYEMTRYLLACGHTKIAFLADQEIPVGVDARRLEGVRQAMAAAGYELHPSDYIALPYNRAERHAMLRQFCRERIRDYSALFFASDFYAVDAMNIFYDLGIRVPDNISVAGFDNNIYAEQCRPMLTTIEQNIAEKSETAWRLLYQLIQGKVPQNRNILLPTKLIIRDSVRKLHKI